MFSPKENHTVMQEKLKSRFEKAMTIPGTSVYHAFIPINNNSIILKKISFSSSHDVFPKPKIIKKAKEAVPKKKLKTRA